MPSITTGPTIADSAQINPGVIINPDISAAAAIDYSKLNLAGGIVNADVAAGAAIADTKLATISTAGKVSGAALTSLSSIPVGAGVIPAANAPGATAKVGVTTRSMTAATGTVNVAHGLGKTPVFVRIIATCQSFVVAGEYYYSFGSWDGTTTCNIFGGIRAAATVADKAGQDSTNICKIIDTGGTLAQAATFSVDGTNLIFSWTKTGAPTGGVIQILWEAR